MRSAWRRDEDAVSAVVGVILMVGIAVAIGAIVYVLATSQVRHAQETPPMSFTIDPTHGTITVVQAPSGTNVGYYAPSSTDRGLGWTGDCVVDRVNGQPVTNTTVVRGGDVLHTTCVPGEGLVLRDSRTNAVVLGFHRPY